MKKKVFEEIFSNLEKLDVQSILFLRNTQLLREIQASKLENADTVDDLRKQYQEIQLKEIEYSTKLEKEIELQTHSLREANTKLERVNKLNSDFLANMSHEIRNPLNSIIGVTELLLESTKDDDNFELLNVIKSSSETLYHLIGDTLDLSKIDAGLLELDEGIVNIDTLFSNLYNTLKHRAKQQGNILTYKIDPSCPLNVYADSVRLSQVIVNLIINSIKFTDKGNIHFEIYSDNVFLKENPNKKIFHIIIKDTGVGISQDSLTHIFDKFYQADSSSAKKYQGTGLGLSIVQSLIELMGGSIHVTSELGIGTEFICSIPLQTINISETIEEKSKPINNLNQDPNKTLRKRKDCTILIVEDEYYNVMVIGNILKSAGFSFELAMSGSLAIDLIKNGEYDLILMDIQMPEMDGYETTKQIRQLELQLNRSRTPIIALTAYALKEYLDSCLKAGMDDSLTKPITDKQKVISKIDYYLNSEPNEKKEINPLPIEKVNSDTNTTENNNTSYEVYVDAELKEIIGKYIEYLKESIQVFSIYIQDKNSEAISVLGHKLKGTGSSYGFHKITEWGKILESCKPNFNIDQMNNIKDLMNDFIVNMRINYEK